MNDQKHPTASERIRAARDAGETVLEEPRRLVAADDLDSLAAELVSLAIFTTRRPDADGSRAFYEQAARFEQQANHIGYPSLADGIGRAKKRDTWPERSEHLRQVAGRARELAGELRQDVDDDARRLADGDEQRDYAEERANAELLRDDPRGIGAALTIPQLTADELEELAGVHVALAPAIARELAKRARQLEELSPLALVALMRAEQLAQQRLDRMRRRPLGAHKAEVIAAAELELEQYARAAQIVAENDTNRRKILRKLGPRD